MCGCVDIGGLAHRCTRHTSSVMRSGRHTDCGAEWSKSICGGAPGGGGASALQWFTATWSAHSTEALSACSTHLGLGGERRLERRNHGLEQPATLTSRFDDNRSCEALSVQAQSSRRANPRSF